MNGSAWKSLLDEMGSDTRKKVEDFDYDLTFDRDSFREVVRLAHGDGWLNGQDDPSLARLIQEAQYAQATVQSGVRDRAAHPSHGHTKTQIRADLARCETLVEAHYLASGKHPGNGKPLGPDVDAWGKFHGIDLAGLRSLAGSMR